MAAILGGVHLGISPCFSSASSLSSSRLSSASASRISPANSRVVKHVRGYSVRASSSSPPASEQANDAAQSNDTPQSNDAAEKSSEEEVVDDPLEFPTAAPATSSSLVSRIASTLTAEGITEIGQVNYYKVLRIPYGATLTEIVKAFKNRVIELERQQKDVDVKTSREEELKTLQAAFDVLTSEEDRRVYDWVLERYERRSSSDYIWPYEADVTQDYDETQIPKVMRSFDDEGDRKVGLFFLAWVLLSFVLSATLKTWLPTHPHYN